MQSSGRQDERALLILKSIFFFLYSSSHKKKKKVFLIFRYKQSHSGDDAEMNMVAECTITVPSAPTERERLAGGKERDVGGGEVRETADRGSAQMGRVEDL